MVTVTVISVYCVQDKVGEGTVDAIPSRIIANTAQRLEPAYPGMHLDPEGWVDVQWDNGRMGAHCMDKLYELDLV